MPLQEKVIENSDSLIALLTAQCSDLEGLLALAREETIAAEQGNFLSILDIVTERERIGKRLEKFQEQTVRLRSTLEHEVPGELASRIVETARMTIEQDLRTRILLEESKKNASTELERIERNRRSVNNYQSREIKGLSCDQRF